MVTPDGSKSVPERVNEVTFAKFGKGVRVIPGGAVLSVFPKLSLHSIEYENSAGSIFIITGSISPPE